MIKKRMTISILRTIAKKGFYADLIADDLIKEGAVIPVRCKDCKYAEKDQGFISDDEYFYCNHDLMEHGQARTSDFCSYGEREEE